jgi:FAD binding domain/Berberine and berberine like
VSGEYGNGSGMTGTKATIDERAWNALHAAISGRVLVPESPDYEELRKPPLLRFHAARPQAVVLCDTPEDVAEAIAFARQHGLAIAPRGGGHCFAGKSSTDGMVVDITPMRSVSLSNGLARIGAGAPLGEVYDALLKEHAVIPAGCGATVGIAGLTLGGGLGILGRKYGLTCDRLVEAQVVLADGRTVTCDEHRNSDLFWALRGAGARNFGVVTSFVFRPLPAPSTTGFKLLWPHQMGNSVIAAWQEWAPFAPDELAASLLLTSGSEPDRPPVLKLFGSMIGTEADTRILLDTFVAKAGAEPTSALVKPMSFHATKRLLTQPEENDPSDGDLFSRTLVFSKSGFFRQSLSSEAIAALVKHFLSERVAGQARELDFTPWGGAYNRTREDATAFVHRNERFILKAAIAVGAGATTVGIQEAKRWLSQSWSFVGGWGTGRVYQNFPDPDLESWASAYYGSNYGRLLLVKRKYDPDNVFHFRQSIGGLKH